MEIYKYILLLGWFVIHTNMLYIYTHHWMRWTLYKSINTTYTYKHASKWNQTNESIFNRCNTHIRSPNLQQNKRIRHTNIFNSPIQFLPLVHKFHRCNPGWNARMCGIFVALEQIVRWKNWWRWYASVVGKWQCIVNLKSYMYTTIAKAVTLMANQNFWCDLKRNENPNQLQNTLTNKHKSNKPMNHHHFIYK